jgi:diaminopimelate epimerase
MILHFDKYQGAGNDFIMLDGRTNDYAALTQPVIERLCDRRFGIGADGLIILRKGRKRGHSFYMEYYNSDGRTSSMCGNGGRCITAFAGQIGIEGVRYVFEAADGKHESLILSDGTVSLQMGNVKKPIARAKDWQVETGSPHYVRFVEGDLDAIPLVAAAHKIRYGKRYAEKGINVNMVQLRDQVLHVRTYERGVEDETFSCGTGVTAAVLAAFHANIIETKDIAVLTKGGNLRVSFEAKANDSFENVWLHGPATHVFSGQVVI